MVGTNHRFLSHIVGRHPNSVDPFTEVNQKRYVSYAYTQLLNGRHKKVFALFVPEN